MVHNENDRGDALSFLIKAYLIRKENDVEYQLIRSNRRTIAIEIKGSDVIVRAPYRANKAAIDSFVISRKDWIEKHLAKIQSRKETAESVEVLTDEQVRELAQKALEIIPERVKYYAPLVGVSYGRITIRNQRSRWGSCSSKGNLNFNCLLMLAPPEVLDSVVVHELCHRKEMNHSRKFYEEVTRVYPDYNRCRKWLKDNGGLLMARLGV